MKDILNSGNMKKILMIAYSFPPVGGGRVRRILKFVKYLKEFEWEPIVLTVKKPSVSVYDYDLINEIPQDIKIIRTNSIESNNRISNILKPENTKTTKKFSMIKDIFYSFLSKLKWWILIPDTRVGWIPFAVLKGSSVIKNEKVDVIYATGEPFSSFLTGVLLKFITRKPLIVDFRDEWVEFNRYFFPQKKKLRCKIEENMERFVIKNSDTVISVTEPIVENFRRRYRAYEHKFVCITNGFDLDDFTNVKISRKEKFSIICAGSLYKHRSPKYFLMGLENLISKNPHIADDINLSFIGDIEPEIISLVNSPILKKIVSFSGFLSYRDTLSRMISSDLLLFIEDQVEIAHRFLSAKIFDYIGAGRPILALCNKGAISEVVQEVQCGKVVSPEDIKAISNAVYEFYSKYKAGEDQNRKINDYIVKKFDRRRLTRQLKEVLEEAIK